MNPLIRPKALKVGDKVGLISTSSSVEYLEDIEKAVANIKKLGLDPVLGKYAEESNEYLAGTDEQRAEDFNHMFADLSIKGIICMRGGYGSIRMLDKINWDMLKKNPKIFVGYSDVTALHTAINKRAGFITYHGPMATIELLDKDLDDLTLTSLKDNIFGKVDNLNLNNYPVKTLVPGFFSGKLVGGNLATIVSTLGTVYDIETDGNVLFLEDIKEPRYKIDRMMTHISLAGKLDKIAGVIVGHITDEKGNMVETLDIIKNILEPLGVPCLYNLPCGHKLPNITLPLGSIVGWNKIDEEIL